VALVYEIGTRLHASFVSFSMQCREATRAGIMRYERTRLALAAHIRSPGNWLARFTQTGS
jgi:hypothetical protein